MEIPSPSSDSLVSRSFLPVDRVGLHRDCGEGKVGIAAIVCEDVEVGVDVDVDFIAVVVVIVGTVTIGLEQLWSSTVTQTIKATHLQS